MEADCLNTEWKGDEAVKEYPLVVAKKGVYRLSNHNIFYVQSEKNNLIIGIGHKDYRKNLRCVLDFIQYDI